MAFLITHLWCKFVPTNTEIRSTKRFHKGEIEISFSLSIYARVIRLLVEAMRSLRRTYHACPVQRQAAVVLQTNYKLSSSPPVVHRTLCAISRP